MRFRKIISSPVLLRVVTLATFMNAFPVQSSAVADTCVNKTLKVSEVKGRVVTPPWDRPEEAVPDASVKISKCHGADCSVVAETVTNNLGSFSFAGIAPGEYQIKAEAPSVGRVFWTIRVNRSSAKEGREIVLILGPSRRVCDGWAEVRKTQKR